MAEGPQVLTTVRTVDRHVITYAGDLDLRSASVFETEVVRVLDLRAGAVEVDLAQVAFCDATALGTLVRLTKYARGIGEQLILSRPPPRMCELIIFASLDDFLPLNEVIDPITVAEVTVARPHARPRLS